jgi:hypothetical protein
VASELVDKLLQNKIASTREDCIKVALELERKGFIYPLNNLNFFKDDKSFYRFEFNFYHQNQKKKKILNILH